MRRSIFLLLLCIATLSCAKVTSHTTNNEQSAPTLENPTPDLTLNREQEEKLNKVLSSKVREILENGKKFSVMSGKAGNRFGKDFIPERVVQNLDENVRERILKSFYYDLVTTLFERLVSPLTTLSVQNKTVRLSK